MKRTSHRTRQCSAAAGADGIAASPGNVNTSAIFEGQTAYVGLACDLASIPTAEETGATVALVQRGDCAFTTKGLNVEAAGYEAIVVFNSEAGGDALVNMGGDPVNIPGLFVGRTDGLALAGVVDVSDPYNPIEVGRYHESGRSSRRPTVASRTSGASARRTTRRGSTASDRNGGLYVLKAYGSGSAKNGKAPRDEG